jgi:hypothetical protein
MLSFDNATDSFDINGFDASQVLEREMLYPIPSQEIRNNANLIQNDGY